MLRQVEKLGKAIVIQENSTDTKCSRARNKGKVKDDVRVSYGLDKFFAFSKEMDKKCNV